MLEIDVVPVQGAAPPDRKTPAAAPARWWGRRWLKTVQALGCVERISRGRAYHRGGHVLDCTFGCGAVVAHVQGSRWPPYEVRIEVEPFDDLSWRRVFGAIARKPVYSARMLAGELPTDVETVFVEAGAPLLPHAPGALKVSCTCPSGESSCKHMAAVHYVVAESLDAEPFSLLALRGRTRRQVVAALRRGEDGARASLDEPLRSEGRVGDPVPLPDDLERFWRAGTLDGFDVDRQPPPAPHALLTRLGPPAAWTGPTDLVELLREIYEEAGAGAGRLMGA